MCGKSQGAREEPISGCGLRADDVRFPCSSVSVSTTSGCSGSRGTSRSTRRARRRVEVRLRPERAPRGSYAAPTKRIVVDHPLFGPTCSTVTRTTARQPANARTSTALRRRRTSDLVWTAELRRIPRLDSRPRCRPGCDAERAGRRRGHWGVCDKRRSELREAIFPTIGSAVRRLGQGTVRAREER